MIRNKTTGKEVVQKHHILKTAVKQSLGLMFKPANNDGYIFELERFGLTKFNTVFSTFFMFFSLDIIFLDKNKVVTRIFTNVRPYKFISAKGKYVLETKAGKTKGMRVGHQLEWEE